MVLPQNKTMPHRTKPAVLLALLGSLLLGALPTGAHSHTAIAQTSTAKKKKKPAASSSKPAQSSKSKSGTVKSHTTRSARRKPATPQTIRLTSAFHATEQLRPMAQHLAASRTAAAYAGVESYARAHPGDPAATAWLAVGHAYMLDRRFADAENAFRQ